MELKDEDDTSDESFDSDDEEIANDGESKPNYAVKDKWINRERVLIFCSRGASYRDRHLMNDLKTLMPHSKGESKIDKKQKLIYINEICEMKNCNKCIYFETRKRKDLYMWLANIERGPSAKFLVQNVHTTGELKLSGNCLKGSRPILSFDKTFDDHPHFELLKELIAQTFSTPNFHPKSQPFIDHVLNFSIDDDRIWLRNYQIVDETNQKLEEIGPRMVLQLIKIFEGSFGGPVLYENPNYLCPNTVRREKKSVKANKYTDKVNAKTDLAERRQQDTETYRFDKTEEEVFDTNAADVDDGSKKELNQLKRQIERKKRKKGAKKMKTAKKS